MKKKYGNCYSKEGIRYPTEYEKLYQEKKDKIRDKILDDKQRVEDIRKTLRE